ncbi:DUF6702 family protein [Segetibacter koreensis]|uniref:DUF6702 family protein n=1 Tax=Segetibacter koreensis TaxID=398037 RepID=UPI00035F6913|nr:DUF6702 family protein [Segetibacter koreensis]
MKARLYRSALVIFLVTYLFFTPVQVYAYHPFYVSVTEMLLNSKTKSLEISCKMFAEDIEDVLKQNYKVPVDLGNDKMQAQNNKLINDYVLKHLSINLDARTTALKFVGFEKDNESVYCYYEVMNVPAIRKITVNNTILQDYKQEQINIMHVIVNGNRKSTKLDYPSNEAVFTF